jgi:hypothetical protein
MLSKTGRRRKITRPCIRKVARAGMLGMDSRLRGSDEVER